MERRAKLYGALSEAQLEAAHMEDEHEYQEEEVSLHSLVGVKQFPVRRIDINND